MKRIINLLVTAVTILAMTFVPGKSGGVTPAKAAGIVVNTSSDSSADDGFCSLREAIANANGNSQSYASSGECAAGSGADSITFNSSLSGGTITLGASLPAISENLNVDGSALSSKITIDGANTYQPFHINSGTVTLDSLIISHGYSDSWGGGVYNASTLTITNSILSNNSSDSVGGGVRNDGTLTITNSTLSNNSTTGVGDLGGGIRNASTLTVTNSTLSGNTSYYGGGIYNQAGTVTVANSTFSGNSASAGGESGGGVLNYGGTLTITNSTFSGNSAGGNGGGIFNKEFSAQYPGIVTLKNSTFSGNSAGGLGGGIYNEWSGTLNYTNTIIANSTSGGDCYNNFGTIGTNTNNLVEMNASSPNDCGTPHLTSDPNLGSLTNNGGATQTMALLSGSPAIDAGDNTVCDDNPGPNNLDQRGMSRPIDSNGDSTATCDIGAYESGYILTVTKTGSGSGTVTSDISSINCGSTCSDNLNPSTAIVLTASPTGGSTFTGWSGSCTGTGTCNLTIDATKSVTANFIIQIQRILNGGLNSYPSNSKIPTSWKATSFAAADGKTTTKKEGTASVKIVGASGKTKSLSQTITLNGSSADTFTFSFWMKGTSVPVAGTCKAQVLFYNGSTLLSAQTQSINCQTGTYGFTQKTLSFSTTAAYTKVVVKFTSAKSSGTIYIDSVSLIK